MSASAGQSVVIDDLDLVILGELRTAARLTWTELGQRIGLGATSTADRVRRLEQIGVLRGYHADVDLSSLGIGLQAITEIRMDRSADPAGFERMLAEAPEVRSAMHVTGAHDYVLMLACEDVATLDRLLRTWREGAGVEESSTRIVLAEIDLAG